MWLPYLPFPDRAVTPTLRCLRLQQDAAERPYQQTALSWPTCGFAI